MKELPAPTTSSALESAITRGEESAKLLPVRVTFPLSAMMRPEITELDMVRSPDTLFSTGDSSLRRSLPEMTSVPPSLFSSAGMLRPACSRRRLRACDVWLRATLTPMSERLPG